jgi:hypothetical protein
MGAAPAFSLTFRLSAMKKFCTLVALLMAAGTFTQALAQTTPGTVSGPTGSGVTITSPAGSSMSQSSSRTTTTSSSTAPAKAVRQHHTTTTRKTAAKPARATTRTTTTTR